MSADFLLELRSEEIPARMQAGARADLEKLFRKELAAAGVAVGAVTVWSTPRRLALIARDLPQATEAVREEVKGPRTSAPEQALDGFLRKTGLSKADLSERDGVWYAVSEKPGRATGEVLAEAIPAIVRAFPWPKSQRWGAASISTASLRWVRPLSGIVALFGGEVVVCEVGGVVAGRVTRGHRFHSSGEIAIDGADDYAGKLRDAHVIVDHAEREALIRSRANEVANAAGLTLVADEGLVVENAGLTEWPVPLLGRFDPEFLEVPPEVIQLTARINQKYFVCEDAGGKLANAFVCTANIEAADGGVAIVAGNRKVLAARLSDARFFWQQDRKVPLAKQAKNLARITFHEKLGSVADKVERVAKLAEWLASEGIVPDCDPALARQAAELCKADLVTEMVGEFPELQGLMGGYYARAEGLPDAVADAIRDHYKPVGQGDEVPTAPVTVAVSLADKLDTIVGFFFIGEAPTGSRDPYALRRQSLAVLRILEKCGVRWNLRPMLTQMVLDIFQMFAARYVDPKNNILISLIVDGGFREGDIKLEKAGEGYNLIGREGRLFGRVEGERALAADDFAMAIKRTRLTTDEVVTFFADRLKVQQKEAGVRHDLIDAVFALGGEDDLVRLLARVHALQAFVGTEDGRNLLAGYKRAANILKKEGWGEAPAAPGAAYEREPAEAALVAALDFAEPTARESVAAEDFAGAMRALASLRQPIDSFFETVTVNDADANKRTARLDLLARFRDAVHNVADFGRIEG